MGFSFGNEGPLVRWWTDNLRSAKEQRWAVQEKLAKEASEGRMVVLFQDWPMEELIVSPIVVVPKKEQGQFRLIQHLFWPERGSVNDFIAEEVASVPYSSVDVAMSLVATADLGG